MSASDRWVKRRQVFATNHKPRGQCDAVTNIRSRVFDDIGRGRETPETDPLFTLDYEGEIEYHALK